MMKSQMVTIFLLVALSTGIAACDFEKSNENNINNVNNINNSNNINNVNNLNNLNNINNTNNVINACAAPPRALWNYDLTVMPPSNVQIPSTCRGQGEFIYVYVADDAWTDGTVDASMVENVVAAWETGVYKSMPSDVRMPVPPAYGIYGDVTAMLGNPPDVDADPHVIVFISKLGSYNGTNFDGYFRRENQVAGPASNLAEMIYLDCEHHAPDSDYLLGVLAHEFTHMIAYGLDSSEEGWLDEVFAQASMVVSGYWSDLSAGASYLATQTATRPLVVADVRDFNYGAGFLFASWVLDLYAGSFFGGLIADPADGEASFNTALEAVAGAGVDIYDLILDWAAAGLLQDGSIGDGRYDYNTLGAAVGTPPVTTVTPGAAVTVNLPLSAYKYYRYGVTANQEVTVTSADDGVMRMLAIFQGGGVTQLLPLLIIGGEGHLTTPEWDGAWTLVVVRTSGAGNVSFTVQ